MTHSYFLGMIEEQLYLYENLLCHLLLIWLVCLFNI